MISSVLEKMKPNQIINYVDDSIVLGEIFDIHLENLDQALEAFEKAGVLTVWLDMLAEAFGSKPASGVNFQERVAERRTANLTNILHGKLPKMLVIGRLDSKLCCHNYL